MIKFEEFKVQCVRVDLVSFPGHQTVLVSHVLRYRLLGLLARLAINPKPQYSTTWE